MADANPSRVGQINLAGDPKALFLKVFSGEVLSAFDRASAFRQRHTVRVIPSGKSAQFPVTGLANAQYHTPGTEILGQAIAANERVIVVDDMIIAPAFIANIDEAMNHYDVRSIYSNEIGQALAKLYDQNVARAIVLASRAAANVTGGTAGEQISLANMDTDGTVLWQSIFNAGVKLDNHDVPSGDRYAALRPTQYALVVMSEKPIDFDLNQLGGPNGSIAEGVVKRINNAALVKTNNLPSADDSANTDIASSLRGDFSKTYGDVFHRSAAGTVQLQDIAMESAYDIRRQGTLMVGKYLVGTDYLRPEASVELTKP